MGLWTDSDKRNGTSYEWLHAPVRPEIPPPPPPPAPPPPRRPRKRLVAAVAGAVLAVSLLTSLVAVQLLGDDRGDTEEAVAPLAVNEGETAETRINQIYDRVHDSVVSIEVRSGGAGGNGSGFVVGDDGTIVTNDHVVENATRVQVRFTDNGDGVPAEVVGTDPSSDLAVLRVDPDEAPELKPLTLADSSQVEVGDTAIAIGFPLGLNRTATSGIVSGLGRTIQAPNNFSISNVIQTDAPINPGNSGGPLFDSRGRVIGVNAQIATAGSRGNVGIGFAIPSNTVRDIVPTLKTGGEVRRAYLGVSSGSAPTGAGAQLAEVTPGGPADAAGLRPGSPLTGAGGDVIVSVDGDGISGPDELTSIIGGLEPGDRVEVEFLRDGQQRSTTVTLGERPRSVPPSP